MTWFFPENDFVLDDGTEIPGTVRLVDLEHNLNVQHNFKRQDIVLVPQPTDHPDDPLNWSFLRKNITLIWPTYYTFMVAVLVAIPAVYYLEQSKDLKISVGDLVSGNGYTFLFFAVGCAIWQPIALNYGRRAIYIYTLLIGGVACPVWSTYVKSRAEYFANRIILGLVLAPVESLGQVVGNDLFFTHERGFGMSYYLYALLFGSLLGPLVGSFVNGAVGWKWVNYILAIMSAVGSVGSYLFMEETMFYRKHQAPPSLQIPTSENGSTDSVIDSSDVNNAGNATTVQEKSKSLNVAVSSQASEDIAAIPPRKTYFQRYPVLYYRSKDQPNRLLFNFLRPFKILVFFLPVVWSGIIVASGLAWWSVAGATIASILEEPPYNFGSTGLGLVYIAPGITSILSTWFGGVLLDKWCIYLAKKNNGVREPEFRLYAGVAALIFTPLGLWLYGVGAAHKMHWIGLVFGYALAGVGSTLGVSIPYAYAIDCYPEIGGDSLVTVIAIRCIIGGFAFSYAITPWIARDGLQNTFIILGFLAIIFWLSCIPMILFGKKLRRLTAHKYRKYVAENQRNDRE